MTIHHVSVKPETIAVLLEAAEASRMTLLDFEGWVLSDWARLYEQHKQAATPTWDTTRHTSRLGLISRGD